MPKVIQYNTRNGKIWALLLEWLDGRQEWVYPREDTSSKLRDAIKAHFASSREPLILGGLGDA